MSKAEAVILLLFGIILPSWDVASDLLLSFSFISSKPCSMTWNDYIRDYKSGIEPITNQEIGMSF